ncbi:MAG: ABC transporter permease, partial [Candidatus Sumerlaeia bacterium]|nr:ABC transporter permease [Candidatus Sumerlaeia bacterium]
MSTTSIGMAETTPSQSISYWRLLWRQLVALVNLSIRRYLFTRYMWVLVILGGVPVLVSILYFLNVSFWNTKEILPPDELNKIFQMIFRTLYIHFIIFFIANIFGFSLLRKEVDDRTLHYLFLQPVSKITVIISKYIAFLLVTWLYLTPTFIITYIIFQLPYGIEGIIKDLFEKGRALSLLKQCLVMFVALAIYGSISMVMGSLFKSGSYGALFYL